VKEHNFDDLRNFSMLDLFRVEAENQTALLASTLLEIEKAPATAEQLEILMRAAHSLKGAARIVNLRVITRLSHAMEDCFVAAQQTKLVLRRPEIDVLLRAVDLLANIARSPEPAAPRSEQEPNPQLEEMLGALAKLTSQAASGSASPSNQQLSSEAKPAPRELPAPSSIPAPGANAPYPQAAEVWPVARAEARSAQNTSLVPSTENPPAVSRKAETEERVVRLTAENLNRLLGLAGESLVESRWLRPFTDSLQRLKRQHADLSQKLDSLRQTLQDDAPPERAEAQLHDLQQSLTASQQFLSARMQELDLFDRRSAHLSHRLYLEVLRTRMRPFADGVRRFPRMVRDVARSLGKSVRLEVLGAVLADDVDAGVDEHLQLVDEEVRRIVEGAEQDVVWMERSEFKGVKNSTLKIAPLGIEHLEAATHLDSQKSYSHYQLARAYLRAGRNEDAQKEFSTTHDLEKRQKSSPSRDPEKMP